MNVSGEVLLDTNIVRGHLRQPNPHLAQAEVLFLPLIVLGELYYGAYKSAQQEKILQRIRPLLQIVILFSPTETTAELYGQIKSELANAGTPLPQNEVWIAALAREHCLPVATRDRHFDQVQNLTVLRW